MDGHRFDELTRAYASVASRRRLLATVAGGLLAALGVHLEQEPASAACRAYGKPCEKGRQCCSKTCSRRKRCACPSGTTKCGAKRCCATGQACVNGTCAACTPGANQACYTGPAGTKDVGVCTGGTQTCRADGTWGPCDGEVTPSNDVCDGRDNDCDGEADGPGTCTGDKSCVRGQCVCDGVRCGTDCACTGGKVCDNEFGVCVCPLFGCSADCPCSTPGYACQNGQCVCDGTRCTLDCSCSGSKVCGSDGRCVCNGVRCGPDCPCPSGKDCRNGECVCDNTRCENGCSCSGGMVCDGTGACVCGTRCGAACPCGEGEICSGGFCRPL